MADPRLAELEQMGLRAVHLRVARAIGVDAFLAAWKLYDEDEGCRTDKGDLQISMRSYRSYLRYQRNRFIEALVAAGLTPKQIRARVRADLCESLHPRHISRIARGK